MLKGIPPLISPEFMAILMRMGHGDEIVLADGNFPADSHSQRIVRCDGHGVPAVLNAILPFFPLDQFVDDAAFVMQPVDDDSVSPVIWNEFQMLVDQYEPAGRFSLLPLERFAFYDRARCAYAIVATGESAVYANLILKKGVVLPQDSVN